MSRSADRLVVLDTDSGQQRAWSPLQRAFYPDPTEGSRWFPEDLPSDAVCFQQRAKASVLAFHCLLLPATAAVELQDIIFLVDGAGLRLGFGEEGGRECDLGYIK